MGIRVNIPPLQHFIEQRHGIGLWVCILILRLPGLTKGGPLVIKTHIDVSPGGVVIDMAIFRLCGVDWFVLVDQQVLYLGSAEGMCATTRLTFGWAFRCPGHTRSAMSSEMRGPMASQCGAGTSISGKVGSTLPNPMTHQARLWFGR